MSSLYFRVFIASYSYSRNEIYVISLDWVLANFARAGKYIAYLSCDIFLLCHLFVVGYLSTRLRELRQLAPHRAFSASTWQGTKEHWNARDGNFGAISIQHPCM